MTTISQLIKIKFKRPKKKIFSTTILKNKPQCKGICIQLMTKNPKKPNSALRKVMKLRVGSGKLILAKIPGEYSTEKLHNLILIGGGKTQDLPGFKYKIIKGALDSEGVLNRKTSCSKYGTKKTKK